MQNDTTKGTRKQFLSSYANKNHNKRNRNNKSEVIWKSISWETCAHAIFRGHKEKK